MLLARHNLVRLNDKHVIELTKEDYFSMLNIIMLAFSFSFFLLRLFIYYFFFFRLIDKTMIFAKKFFERDRVTLHLAPSRGPHSPLPYPRDHDRRIYARFSLSNFDYFVHRKYYLSDNNNNMSIVQLYSSLNDLLIERTTSMTNVDRQRKLERV